jgi:hypothetical protein
MKNIALMASAGASQPFYTRLTATSTSIGEHSTALMWRSSTMPDTPLTPTGRYFTEHFLDMRPHDIISIEQEAALAHIDALTAAVEGLDEPFQWLVDNYPKAMREMPTHVLRRFDAVRALLARR